MKLSRLTPEGIAAFKNFLDNIQSFSSGSKRKEILESGLFSEIVSDIECIDVDKFPTSKIKATKYLHDLVSAADIVSPEKDIGLWSWLSLMYFDKISKKDSKGNYKSEFLANYILIPENYSRYYKHKLAGPWRIYKIYADKPEITLSILAGTIETPGDVYAQLASRQEIVSNSSLIELATYLYFDKQKKKLKLHAASKNVAGCSRRLAAVIQQFSRTWDIYGMDYKAIAGLLPNEFNKFMS